MLENSKVAAKPAVQNPRFSYVKYDEKAQLAQEKLKDAFETIELLGNILLKNGRPKSRFLTHLEEAYMWTGKAIRDEQIERNAGTLHEPARTNSPE